MKFRVILLAAAVAFSTTAMAQGKKSSKKEKEAETEAAAEDDGNLVPNGSFEDITNEKDLKAAGLLKALCTPWETPNATSADLFSEGLKSTKVSAPANDYGAQAPAEGKRYAGFRAATKDPKKTRTYLSVKLKQRLEKDKIYCVKFQISLADLSKNGVNNVGIFVSDRKVQNSDDATISFTPQIVDKTNKAITMMDGWETICGTYIAKGTEEYIIIGGFGADDKMKFEKAKKPAGITGTVMNEAYYYIDNIEFREVEAASQCNCGKAEERVPDLIYSKAGAVSEELKPEQKVEQTAVYFAAYSADVPGLFEADVLAVAEIMKNNPNMKLELEGHMDNEEFTEAKIKPIHRDLPNRRAESVKAALVAAGIDASRITITTKDNTMPASTRDTPMGKAQNRRVEFNLR